MHKRPAIRTIQPCTTVSARPAEGTFLHSIIRPEKTRYFEMTETYIDNYDNYIHNLRKSCEESGIEFKIPKYILPLPHTEQPPARNTPPVDLIDKVILRVNVLKNGKVRVKLLTNMATLYEKYFSKSKIPPVKVLASALKAVGYDDTYVSNIAKNLETKKVAMDKRWKTLEESFNKPSASNLKKKPKKEEPEPEQEQEQEQEEEEEENEDDDAAPDEEAIVDEEIDDEEEVEVVEDDYFSDED